MAYVPFSDQEDKQSNGTAAPQGGGNALPTTGGGGGSAPAGGMAAPSAAPKSANQGFANINQYLTANEGQGGQVAGTVASNLQNQYSGLQGDINSAANQATEAVKGGSTAYDPNLINSAVANPSQFVADPNNLAAWQKQYNAAYTGPTAFEQAPGYAKAANAANKASQTYQLGQTGGGYTQLLNQIEKNPTVGRTALDKSLIQSDPNSQQTIQGALSPFKGIQDLVSGKSAEIGKQAAEAGQQAAETSKKAHAAASGAEQTLEQNLGNKLTQAQQDATAKNAKVNALLNASPQTEGEGFSAYTKALRDLGLDEDQTNAFQNARNNVAIDQSTPYINSPAYGKNYTGTKVDISPFAKTNNPIVDYTKYNVATPEDYANAEALSKLTNSQNNFLPNEFAAQAGTAPQSPSFDLKGAANALVDPLQKQTDWYKLAGSNSGALNPTTYAAGINNNQLWQNILKGIQ